MKKTCKQMVEESIKQGCTLTTEQRKVVYESLRRSPRGEVLTYGATDEKDEDDRRGDPEGPVQVRVPLEHIKKVGTRVQCRPTATQHGRCVDVEELRIVGNGPEISLARDCRRCRW